MTLLGRLFRRGDMPLFIRRRALRKLLEITGEAFGVVPPSLSGLTFDQSLETYAGFTKREVDYLREDAAETENVKDRLFRSAESLGKRYRKFLGVTKWNEAVSVSRRMYGHIGIDMDASERGEITFRSCYFSRHYSPHTCSVISALDAGMMSGLAGGGELTFHCRITEGAGCCRAEFRYERPEE